MFKLPNFEAQLVAASTMIKNEGKKYGNIVGKERLKITGFCSVIIQILILFEIIL